MTMIQKKNLPPTPPDAVPLYRKVRIGRPPLFETAEQLWGKALEYFDWCDDNPIKTNIGSKMRRGREDYAEQKQGTISRPYTLDGLCLYCNILMPWATFKQHCKDRVNDADGFRIVINACEQVIRDQQLTGAMVGEFSERLTARLNGISERIEHEVEQRQTRMSFEDYCRMMRGEDITAKPD